MIWYEDEKLGIYFNERPHVHMRYISPDMSLSEQISIERYPFINKRDLEVVLEDKKKDKLYNFTIPKGYCFDGATIPRMLWRLIGSKTDNTFLIAALIHDWLCEHHGDIDNDRNFSSKVFKVLLRVGGVCKCKAQVMYLAVDNYQRFCGWGNNG